MKRVDQLLAGYAAGDAISQEARIFRSILRGAGYESDIFVPNNRIAPDMRDDCRRLDEFAATPAECVILHYSTKSAADKVFEAFRGRRFLRYHNITPAHYYAGYDDSVAAELTQARTKLIDVAKSADCCWSDSEYNAAELGALGVSDSVVLPLMFRMDEFETEADAAAAAEFGGGLVNWLFVGRIAPNKNIEDLITAFGWYRLFNPRSRLIIVGSAKSCPRYYAMLRLLAARLELNDVCFTGFVTNPARYSIYGCADLFVTASLHEGYCLPLVESMARGVPVIARECGGMPEALGGGGVLYQDADARELAVLAHHVISDADLHSEVLESQQKRVDEIKQRDSAAELLELLNG